ncbi:MULTISPECIES: phage repressor protein [Vibrio]|jgi:phage repressor protein C with HTH and peptisase S24 domain|nr:phage repressor protein [Vibrio bathopelagicus]AKN36576.1 putative phage repressor [Vibrio tasmaniensis]CAK1836859.1 putative phage repressor [Vibrio crassostreae]CAK2694875.1 putative phage repressor [Vibrio crassostreae]CAK3194398.1 putative phage repressor [Vibrio crassostreae]CAK3262373.1 putative phage repressor [Vibrio crassostreae]
MKEWIMSDLLIELEGMPNSITGIGQKARRNKWLKRKAIGHARAVEYHISNFHPDIQKQIIEKLVTNPLEREKLLKKDWTIPPSNAHGLRPLDDFEDWAKLPVYDVHAAAGAGALIESEYQIGVFSLPVELLHEYGLKPCYSSIIFVDGDSMEPTLSHKDRLLVDIREQQHPVATGVYVIRIDEAVYVKRLQWDIENGLYKVISDNLRYPAFSINHQNGRNFKIIGKAVAPVMKKII